MGKPFDFSDFCVDSITIKSLNAVVEPDGGMGTEPMTKYANVAVSFQPIAGDKQEVLAQQQIVATHVALCPAVLDEVTVGDLIFVNNEYYEVTYFEAQGGTGNVAGDVFAIYAKRWVGDDPIPSSGS